MQRITDYKQTHCCMKCWFIFKWCTHTKLLWMCRTFLNQMKCLCHHCEGFPCEITYLCFLWWCIYILEHISNDPWKDQVLRKSPNGRVTVVKSAAACSEWRVRLYLMSRRKSGYYILQKVYWFKSAVLFFVEAVCCNIIAIRNRFHSNN